MAVSCVDVNSGDYKVFYENSTDPVKAIVSSASIPFTFPQQVWDDGVVCMDGGTVWNTNLVSAIERCKEIVDDESEITLDIVMCSRQSLPEWDDKDSTMNNYMRFKDIKQYNDNMDDIFEFKKAYPSVNFRHLVIPSQDMPSGMAILDVDNATSTWPMQQLGRKDGEAVVSMGDGYFFKKMDEWEDDPAIRAEYPLLGKWMEHSVDEVASRPIE